MGLALAKTIEIEKQEENSITSSFQAGESIAVDLIQNADENIIKRCAAKLYVTLVGVMDDYYNVYYGRYKKTWERKLKAYILDLRKTINEMISDRLLLLTEVPDYIFRDDPLMHHSITFPKVAYLIYKLLHDLQTQESLNRIF